MGYLDATVIEKAGNYLLSVLVAKNSAPYSTFYDGTDETHERLCELTGLDDWYGPEGVVDEAAYQLEALGIVTIRELDSELADGELDYLIELTEAGRQKLEHGDKPVYRSINL